MRIRSLRMAEHYTNRNSKREPQTRYCPPSEPAEDGAPSLWVRQPKGKIKGGAPGPLILEHVDTRECLTLAAVKLDHRAVQELECPQSNLLPNPLQAQSPKR